MGRDAGFRYAIRDILPGENWTDPRAVDSAWESRYTATPLCPGARPLGLLRLSL